ncbi:MAG: PhoH family protein [Deferribacteres bacterium]|nr:PhoH family protein [candidate division KSB1 bacterium]MCB9500385.1 PhoH family protein [Deferribacteres bacterium]
MPGKSKLFVLDTNVILHDHVCINHFGKNDIIIPITVLEELDQFKKGNDTINFHAREFVRHLDKLSRDKIFDHGVPIGPGFGKIIIKFDQVMHETLRFNFSDSKPDHRILNTAFILAQEKKEREVILVTKDVNLRMKAKSIGIKSEDYKSDHVPDISTLYTGKRILDGTPGEVIDKLYNLPFEVPASEFPLEKSPLAHEYFIVRNGQKSGLAKYEPQDSTFHRVDKTQCYGITPRNAEQTFALNALLDTNIQLVTIAGKAGTGKTLLALAAALERRKNYRQIYLARPVVPLSNKDIGYLPGDISAKLDPYMQPLYDNLAVIRNQFNEKDRNNERIRDYLENEKLIITPLSYIRGRSLSRIYFIVDEAQNLTPHEIKTIITRAGEGTKMIFTGDIFQIDHPYLDTNSNGLTYLIEKMKGQEIYAHVMLEKGERSPLAELASNVL